jgi:hypothetical protein
MKFGPYGGHAWRYCCVRTAMVTETTQS